MSDKTAVTTQTAPTEDRSFLADPGPIGLVAFAATTMILSVFNAGLLDSQYEPVVLPVALIFGGAVQLIAGIFEVLRKNIFGAVAFTTYGAFWIAFNGIAPMGLPAKAVGVFLLAFAIITVCLTLIAFKTTASLLATFILLSITFILLVIGAFSGASAANTAAGYVGLATALVAWYAGFGGVAKATWGRAVLPDKAF